MVPDEDPFAEPTVDIHGHDELVIPNEIFRWFMEEVVKEVERCHPVALQADRNPSDGPEKRELPIGPVIAGLRAGG
jgi:hypothetical protein